MVKLALTYSPDPLLSQRSKPVEMVDDDIRKLMDDMLETMYAEDGVGLAAVQVGILKRVLVMDVDQGSEGGGKPYFLANPEIIESSDEIKTYDEGCLSFPGARGEVERPKIVTVKYLDYNNEEQTLHADGLLATCVQHEIDHLNGVTFVDHLSNLKRNMIIKKMKKAEKARQQVQGAM